MKVAAKKERTVSATITKSSEGFFSSFYMHLMIGLGDVVPELRKCS